jgi:iron(III) transport system permease protein
VSGSQSDTLSAGTGRARPAFRLNFESYLLYGGSILVVATILYPLLMIMLSSFSQTLIDRSPTLHWYYDVYTNPATWSALLNTAYVVIGVTALASFLGLSLAWIVIRTDIPLPRFFETAVIMPFLMSPLIGALAWSWLGSPANGLINQMLRPLLGWTSPNGPIDIYSVGGIIWVLGIFCTPYMFMFTATALKSVDPVLEEAARISGSRPLASFYRVTIRLISPAVFSGLMFTAIIAAGNFDVPGIIGIRGNKWVFSTLIYSAMHEPPNPPRAAALSSLVVILTMVMLWAQLRIMGFRQFVTISGKGWRGTRIRLGRWRAAAVAFCLAYLLFAVIAPFGAIIYGSLVPPWGGSADLSSYNLVLYEYNTTWVGVRTSTTLAVLTAVITVLLGTLIAYVLVRSRYFFRRPLEYVSMLPAAVPGTAFAVGVLVAFIRPPVMIYGTTLILLVAYVAHFIPFGVRTSATSLHQCSPELEESSRVSGATWLTTMRRVTVPLIAPGLVTGWIVLFVITIRELPLSVILYTPGHETVSVVMYGMWEEGNEGAAAALAVVVTIIALVVVTLARVLVGRFTRA